MNGRGLGRFCLSVVLAFSILLQMAPSAAVRSANPGWQVDTPPTPPREEIVTIGQGLEKLSPDLREIVISRPTPIPGIGLAQEGASEEEMLVSALLQPGTEVERFFSRSVRSREIAGMQWVTGELKISQLRKLASVPDVVGIISPDTFQTVEAPGLDELRRKYPRINPEQAQTFFEQGSQAVLLPQVGDPQATQPDLDQDNPTGQAVSGMDPAGAPVKGVLDIHDVRSAHQQGITGQGVTVAVVDTGVDFAHPDLQGTYAVNQSGPYAGWPFAYDTYSGALYALDPANTLEPEKAASLAGYTQYVRTLPVQDAECKGAVCGAVLNLAKKTDTGTQFSFTWPDTSKSHSYYYSLHPDYYLPVAAYYSGISYPGGSFLMPPVVVSDEQEPGVYDTVYADLNYNFYLGDPGEKMTRDRPVSGVDTNKDDLWDFSGGLLTWISDGQRQPPGVETLYPQVSGYPIPEAGRLLVFTSDQAGHGTNCASEIAGQGRISDPKGYGPTNPLYAGAVEKGGVGGPVIQSVAPGAKIAAFQNGFGLPFDAWTLAVLGFDGQPDSGDEANIVSNSWGNSWTVEDGWDTMSRFAHRLAEDEAANITFLAATGNGGHGYGTETAPGGGSIIDVGASTAYGSVKGFEYVQPEQFVYGEVQPWSNRGPGALGDVAPDIVAVGAWGTGANPLNIYYGNGQSAYDIFGGTSMSTPVAAGSLALVYQAFGEEYQRWPTWEEARTLLLGTAQDLGYDVYVQGAGNVQAGRAVEAARRMIPRVEPVQWQAGNYRGVRYADFPALLHPGETDEQTFFVTNPTGEPFTAPIAAKTLEKVHDEVFSFSYTNPPPESKYDLPIYLADLSELIDTYQPDLMRAQVILPYNTFDVNDDYFADSTWSVYFYDWQDQNENGRLWADENRDGRVDEEEIDIDPETGVYEYNRFTWGYPHSTYIEASLGKQGLAKRYEQDHRIFLGLNCSFCGHSTSLHVRVSFYRKADWGWLEINPGASLSVPAGGSADFTAALTVPVDASPGSYEGAIELNINGSQTILPVTAIVAASQPSFRFGGSGDLRSPYDNGHLFGGYDWRWRYEAGDWRFFYYDVDLPEGDSGAGKAMVIDTRWNNPKTDVDTWIFGPAQDSLTQPSPQSIGPQGLQLIGGSQDSHLWNGKFKWATNTGYARELISVPVQEGLGMIALHNVLAGGVQFAEEISGTMYRVASDPAQVDILSAPDGNMKPYLSGSQTVTLTSTADMDEGITVEAFGISATEDLKGQKIVRSPSADICSNVWVYRENQGGLKLNRGGLLEIATSSKVPELDLDVYLFQDNGDQKLSCSKDHLHAYSMRAYADEKIKIFYPEDGTYWVLVKGVEVPDGMQEFDIRIRAVQGSSLSLRNVPIGPVKANTPLPVTVDYHTYYPENAPELLEGMLLVGVPADTTLIEVPIRVRPTILLYPEPVLAASPRWINTKPVPVTLSFQNIGANVETVRLEITLPEGLEYQPNSAAGPSSPLVYHPETRTFTWEGPITGGQKASFAFQVTGQPGYPPDEVVIPATVRGDTSGQVWKVMTKVLVNTYGTVLPLIMRR